MTAAPLPDGFVAHDGGDCPVACLSDRVSVLWGDGEVMLDRSAISFTIGPENWSWRTEMIAPSERIIAYRKEPENG